MLAMWASANLLTNPHQYITMATHLCTCHSLQLPVHMSLLRLTLIRKWLETMTHKLSLTNTNRCVCASFLPSIVSTIIGMYHKL